MCLLCAFFTVIVCVLPIQIHPVFIEQTAE